MSATASWRQGSSFVFTSDDMQNYFTKTFKTVCLVEVNGNVFGKFYNTSDGNHAEDNFMRAFDGAIAAMKAAKVLRSGYLNFVVVRINNSPCHRCAARLLEWIKINNDDEGEHLQVTFICANAYAEKKNETAAALEDLCERPDFDIDWWNISLDAALSGIDMTRIVGEKAEMARVRKTLRASDFLARFES